MPEAVTEPAPAKINPFLRVLGRRDDGYHDIETLILPVTLADGVQVVAADDLQLRVVGDLAADVPPGEENLVLVAARALKEKVGERRGAGILLSKRVPLAAGLGGGSADAAATLRALDRLWGCGLGVEGLGEVAAEVGSDVPALLHNGPVIARGRGELVEPVVLPKTWWVLVTNQVGISTREAYAWWDSTEEETTFELEPLLSLLEGGHLKEAAVVLHNDLRVPLTHHRPDVEETRIGLERAGALGVVISGSGPTVAGLASDPTHAEEVAARAGGIVVASIGRNR